MPDDLKTRLKIAKSKFKKKNPTYRNCLSNSVNNDVNTAPTNPKIGTIITQRKILNNE